MNKILIIISILFFLLSAYLLFDNASLLEKNKAYQQLSAEYENSFERYLGVTDCIDQLEQYELNDGTIVVKALDIKGCVEEIKNKEN